MIQQNSPGGRMVTVPVFQVEDRGSIPTKGQYAEYVSVNHILASPDQGVKMVPASVRKTCLHPCEGCPCSQSPQGDHSHHGWVSSQLGS